MVRTGPQACRRVAAALAEWRQVDQIAQPRGVRSMRVRDELTSIFAKLDVTTPAQLVGRVTASLGAFQSRGAR